MRWSPAPWRAASDHFRTEVARHTHSGLCCGWPQEVDPIGLGRFDMNSRIPRYRSSVARCHRPPPLPLGCAVIRDCMAWHGGCPNLSQCVRCTPGCGFHDPLKGTLGRSGLAADQSSTIKLAREVWQTLSARGQAVCAGLVDVSVEPTQRGVWQPQLWGDRHTEAGFRNVIAATHRL